MLDKRIKLHSNKSNTKYIIDKLRDWGYNIYSGTNDYNPEFPLLLWTEDGKLVQCGKEYMYFDIELFDIEEFLAIFNPHKEPVYEIY